MTGRDNTPSRAGDAGPEREATIHASCVALDRRGLVILGPSGSGKSGLALSMMALGATLVADDRVTLTRSGNALIATAPDPITGLIEARGIGLLRAVTCGPVPVTCVVDLDRSETARMPPARRIVLAGRSLALLFRVDAPHFPAALMQYLKQGRRPEP